MQKFILVFLLLSIIGGGVYAYRQDQIDDFAYFGLVLIWIAFFIYIGYKLYTTSRFTGRIPADDLSYSYELKQIGLCLVVLIASGGLWYYLGATAAAIFMFAAVLICLTCFDKWLNPTFTVLEEHYED